jgi:hypothetical protein
MRKIHLIAATGFVWFGLADQAVATTVVPLNTGFNHATGSVYPIGARDDYWINIASSLPTNPAADRTWTIPVSGSWQPSLPGSTWISARNTISSNVDPVTKMGYTIFRKCFCMMSFSQAQMSFRTRADDNITIWLNTTLSTLVAPIQGAFGSPTPRQGGTTDQSKFKVGVNCLYALVEDVGGYMGFDLAGNVSAFGLMPMPASGTDVSFKPCGCDFVSHPGGQPGAPAQRAASEFNDREVVDAIIKIAEARRAAGASPARK